ncbi:MAG: proton-conducting transporter membrane subunit [Eubacteriales bacterium]|nr:proton-conducting transporter membrane subunit [Eubacteriales bacterium]
MSLWQNLPFFSIMLSIFSAALCSVLPRRVARVWTVALPVAVLLMNTVLTVILVPYGDHYTYMMGHYPAPWGNEIRVGLLESVTACVFSAIMALSVLGGWVRIGRDVRPEKQNLYCVVLCLLNAALLVMVYTNDLFTGYVFLEIMTLAACTLITARSKGRTLVAATRYMVMNLLGSGLFLLGVVLLYDLTGHLLMSNIRAEVERIVASGQYHRPLIMAVGLISVGLAIKSALFPFHTWLPDAYGYSTPTSSAILSSLVSKGYIFLLIKVFCRVIGLDFVRESGITDILFALGVIGNVMGSLSAIRERDIRRMISFSSVAQIGYIYMGIGMGTQAGLVAAIFQIFAHGMAKSMLFLASSGLSYASGESKFFRDLRGAALRNPWAGVAFTVGAFSMTGIPFLGGFIVKILLSQAAMSLNNLRTMIALLSLAASAALNTVYFLKTVITIYRTPDPHAPQGEKVSLSLPNRIALGCFVAVNLALGVFSQPVVKAIRAGLSLFE